MLKRFSVCIDKRYPMLRERGKERWGKKPCKPEETR